MQSKALPSALQPTDIRDGRLHTEGRAIILADPVRERLRAYLDMRQQRWTGTANPHPVPH
ncbi:hypothetical protein AB0J74_24625 [Asanoa sp. NPDC049573]|uniref:hypothetical protein n=1 Tax=Asanoa sp. NPDC049573 TaxID=3155396 RepID=UPI003420E49F